jgi:hypothetical protein
MKKSVTFILAATFTSQVYAWGDLGHSAVGYLAEENLTLEGKAFMNSIMGGEPMSLSATWPDAVRDDARFEPFANYHFFEIPDGMSYGKIPADRIAPRSADTIIERGPEFILLQKSPRVLNLVQKQIMMRYFIHVVGDVHQPLHIGNGVDRGGNLCDVKMPGADGKHFKTNLHSAWDTAMPELLKSAIIAEANTKNKPIKYFSHRHLIEAIVEEAKNEGTYYGIAELAKNSSKADWYNESQALRAKVYPDDAPVASTERPYCKVVNHETGKVEDGKYDPEKIPVLTQEYIKNSLVIIKKRIILAGLRLANEINKMARVRGDRAWTPEKEAEFFKKVMPVNSTDRFPSSVKNSKKNEEHKDWCHEEH